MIDNAPEQLSERHRRLRHHAEFDLAAQVQRRHDQHRQDRRQIVEALT